MSLLRAPLYIGMAAAAAAFGYQDDAPLKARELFYKPMTATPAAKPQAKAPPAKPKGTSVVKRAPPVEPPVTTKAAEITTVSYRQQPLGLKYTILKLTGDKYREVDPDTEFRSGDRIRINVESNDTAFLYIVMQGTSGTWRPLFPNPAISGGNNRIDRGKVYQIPPADSPSFYFDEQPGTEKVSLILTRTPEEDLEKLIYATGERNKGNGDAKTIMAKNATISGAIMGHVQQQMLSRDLVFEKADESGPDGKTEKAMYVATPDTSAGARVFVDLKLIHK
ncbi:MAG: hypothetical protein JWO80_482 [Bryobacterales bacterium]|nr:hypothetical protein [Bryobacterales bacterium]